MKENLGLTDERELPKIYDFMKLFNRVLQLDSDKGISEVELKNLKEVMFFASVTSVNTGEKIDADVGKEVDFRKHHYKIAVPMNEIINVKCKALFKGLRIKNGMATFQCNRGNKYHNYSDLFGFIKGETLTGIPYNFGYSLKINPINTLITFELFVCLKGNVFYPKIAKCNDGFWKFFDEAPIKRDMYLRNQGLNAYVWEDVKKFSYDDNPPIDEMVEVINEALIEFKEFVERRELELKS